MCGWCYPASETPAGLKCEFGVFPGAAGGFWTKDHEEAVAWQGLCALLVSYQERGRRA